MRLRLVRSSRDPINDAEEMPPQAAAQRAGVAAPIIYSLTMRHQCRMGDAAASVAG
ncbi:hypothetical protein G3480_24980 [Thiorhodococcus mannitoliphagus]|uniref:Uncharacterized protein n=1 Tax=Thiorhodococcus mannitoliphagus TaxID=329406 RepID=A0A6P1DZ40_9GAMM|nr:hypothetical protein [Thiorhodococcus mannitoliphagus]NEX23498.1 hypothetical protein [Thiorhodococcus mannitoliphagus]